MAKATDAHYTSKPDPTKPTRAKIWKARNVGVTIDGKLVKFGARDKAKEGAKNGKREPGQKEKAKKGKAEKGKATKVRKPAGKQKVDKTASNPSPNPSTQAPSSSTEPRPTTST